VPAHLTYPLYFGIIPRLSKSLTAFSASLQIEQLGIYNRVIVSGFRGSWGIVGSVSIRLGLVGSWPGL